MYKTDCLYLPMYVPVSLFHVQMAVPISTKFCTDLHTNSGKVLNIKYDPTNPIPNPGGIPIAQNLSRSWEKNFV